MDKKALLKDKLQLEKSIKEYNLRVATIYFIDPVLKRGWTIDYGMGCIVVYNKIGEDITDCKTIQYMLNNVDKQAIGLSNKDYSCLWWIIGGIPKNELLTIDRI